jgi:acyl-CoA thioesterase FadM
MDTDAAGIYHWTTVARFFESAEAALFRGLDLPQETLRFTPRVSVHLEFRSPLRFGEEAWIVLGVTSVGRASLQYALTVTDLDGSAVAEGEIVCCLVDPDGGRARPWPAEVRSALQTRGRVGEG